MIGHCKIDTRNSAGQELDNYNLITGNSRPFSDLQGNKVFPYTFNFSTARPFGTFKKMYFGPDERLIGKSLTAVELIDATRLPVLPGNVDNPVADANGWIVFVDECDKEICSFPLNVLCRTTNGNKIQFLREIKPDWSKTYLFYIGGALTNANGLQFNFFTQ